MTQADLVKETFGEKMFAFTGFLQTQEYLTAIAPIINFAILLGFALFALQLAKDVYGGIQGDQGWKNKAFFGVVKVIVVIGVLKTIYSSVIMKTLLGGIPETIAETLGAMSMEEFMKKQLQVFDCYSGSKSKIGSFLHAGIQGAVMQIIAAAGFFIMSIISMAVPLVQKGFFVMCAYIGPFAFVALFFDYTRGVFDRWLGMTLAIAWMPVVHSIAMWIFVSGGTMDLAISGASMEDVFTVAISSISSVMILISSPFISVYLFGAMGSGMEKASVTGAIAGAARWGARGAMPVLGGVAGATRGAGYRTEMGSNGQMQQVKKPGMIGAMARGIHSVSSGLVESSSRPGSASSAIANALAGSGGSSQTPSTHGASVPSDSNTSATRGACPPPNSNSSGGDSGSSGGSSSGGSSSGGGSSGGASIPGSGGS